MKCYIVDAFSDEIFKGNPAAVCVMEKWPDEDLMQNIAAENNLSETAFAVKENNIYKLRWFTPKAEIDLCGHATLACAYIIMKFVEKCAKVVFSSKSGILTVFKNGELYKMDFPLIIPEKYRLTQQMTDALGAEPIEVWKGRDLIFVLKSADEVKNLKPNFENLIKIKEGLGVFVCAKDDKYDFVSRAFWPKMGVNEDPVCGSMYCSLTPLWVKKLSKTKLIAKQVSKRTGIVHLELKKQRVAIAGKACLYATSEICIDL